MHACGTGNRGWHRCVFVQPLAETGPQDPAAHERIDGVAVLNEVASSNVGSGKGGAG